jgi:O-ureido-D-serine cyclo-ligase
LIQIRVTERNSSVTRIGLVSATGALALDEDMPPLVEAVRRAGALVETPCWDDAGVDWSRYDVAVLRSTWNYVDRIDDFVAWARRCARETRLLNTPDVVAWNTDKHYLVELAAAGIGVVPTRFVEPGAATGVELQAFLAGGAGAFTVGATTEFAEFVIKPSIGAGSRDAARYPRADAAAAHAHLARLVESERRSAMLQPYLDRVDLAGETGLVYLGGQASHAIRKGAILRPGSDLVAGLFAPEQISVRQPEPDEARLAARAYAAIPFDAPLYARIDMIRDGQGAPVVLELELTEPSLFLAQAPGSADRLARALLARCG